MDYFPMRKEFPLEDQTRMIKMMKCLEDRYDSKDKKNNLNKTNFKIKFGYE